MKDETRELVDLDRFLRESGESLDYWRKRWKVSRGFISRCRDGEKRFGMDTAFLVFQDVIKVFPEWTILRYIDDWPDIHARYLRRQRKLDLWDSAEHTGEEQPPCGACGDAITEHVPSAPKGACKACHDCTSGYVPWIRRGRPMNTKVVRRIRASGTRHLKESKEYSVAKSQQEV
jgi:hypothetical protein